MSTIDVTPPLICDEMDIPALPTLPEGISLDAALPGIGTEFSARLCCKIFQVPIALPPIDLGISIQLPLVVALNGLIKQLNAYRAQIPMICPRE